MMKSQLELLQMVLEDFGDRCSISTTRDYETVARRLDDEGFSFLTITLPAFGKDFEKSLDCGQINPGRAFTGWKFSGGPRGYLPRFLGGFLGLVFNPSTGRLLDVSEKQIMAIQAIRQITLLYGKINHPCTETRVRAAIRKYIKCEEDVIRNDIELQVNPHVVDSFARIGRLLWAGLLSSIDNSIYAEGVLPKHGPGATADLLRGNAKYDQAEWPARMEEIPGLTHWENLISSESFVDRLVAVNILDPGAERPVRVITVPKTLKTPRIIAIEPTAMQYMQQGILEVMVRQIERDDNARNFVKFDEDGQEINRLLAQEGSAVGRFDPYNPQGFATLDLSEASDRVSMQHVRLLLANHTVLREAVEATRSLKAAVPGNGVIHLSKFASMGSALCFPFEALVFTTVVFLGIETALGRPLRKRDIKSLRGKVRVYGDDIIVPSAYASCVSGALSLFGFEVNHDKSFWDGMFRESCGGEFYAGHDVTVSRVRTDFPTSHRHGDELMSTVSLRNRLAKAGLVRSVRFLDQMLLRITPLPWVSETSALLGRHICLTLEQETDFNTGKTVWPSQSYKYDSDLHRPLVRGGLVEPRSPISNLDDYGALMKWFLKRGEEPFQDVDHLLRAGRPRAVRIKTRWTCPF